VQDFLVYVLKEPTSIKTPSILTDLLTKKIISKEDFERLILDDDWRNSKELNTFLEQNPDLNPKKN
jgi:hypothetical protein